MSIETQPREPTLLTTRRTWPAGTTILRMFWTRVRELGPRVALRYRVGPTWQTESWAEYGRRVEEVAAGLRAAGIEAGDRVAILSLNRREWHEADLGIMSIGAVSVPIYPTSAGNQVAYVLGDAQARICFVEDADQRAKILEHRDELPALERVVVLSGDDLLDDPFVDSYENLRAIGAQHLADHHDEISGTAESVGLDELATLVYTSGTTGPPKGTMITHGNIMGTMRGITSVIELRQDERFLSFLPLSHITERSVSHFGQVVAGGETWFAGSITTVGEDLPDCRPTIFFAVPRVWEKLHDAIVEQVEGLTEPQRMLARRYLSLGPARVAEQQSGVFMPFVDKVQWLALDRLVGAKVRRQLGLDHARLLVSGAAPIHPDLIRFFHGIGLPIAEGYGQTEVCLATSLNPPDRIRIGTVGPPLPGVSVRIADDGEILVRGDNVCHGYYRNEAATEELLADGWLHSGDVGRFDEYGYLQITDRKKDLIITAHGKNIAPQVLETDLKQEPLVGNAVVIGEGRRYLTALLTLDDEVVSHWAHERGKPLAIEALRDDPDLREALEGAVARVNARHARVENVRKWRVLPHDFTIAADELTPTLKVRRKVIRDHYADVIDEMYAES